MFFSEQKLVFFNFYEHLEILWRLIDNQPFAFNLLLVLPASFAAPDWGEAFATSRA
jgi:hypothetical protein